MSAQYLIAYAGLYYREGTWELVPARCATIYTSEAEGWHAAYQAGLSPDNASVIPRDAALAKEVA